MKASTDNKPQGTETLSWKQGPFKNKNSKYKKSESTTAGEFLTCVSFKVGPNGLELYLKTKDRLGLYASTQFKNGSDITKSILNEKLIKPQ